LVCWIIRGAMALWRGQATPAPQLVCTNHRSRLVRHGRRTDSMITERAFFDGRRMRRPRSHGRMGSCRVRTEAQSHRRSRARIRQCRQRDIRTHDRSALRRDCGPKLRRDSIQFGADVLHRTHEAWALVRRGSVRLRQSPARRRRFARSVILLPGMPRPAAGRPRSPAGRPHRLGPVARCGDRRALVARPLRLAKLSEPGGDFLMRLVGVQPFDISSVLIDRSFSWS
jgi:hypothetical protein